MILGIGVDILDISRIKLDHAKRVLSAKEIEVLNQFGNEKRKLEYLAGRFSIKEAIIKAIGNTEYRIGMRDITILNDDSGQPYIEKPIYNDIKIHISISHENNNAIGFCIIENV